MKLPDYNAPSALAAVLDEHGFGMQKKFGQNFLINAHIRQELISALEFSAGDTVWEVGPGLGSMTSLLLEAGADLTVFEIDRGFVQLLTSYFGSYHSFHLIEGDVLKTWKTEYQRYAPKAFFGNLPYNIAAKLIAATIEAECFFDCMVITVQKEVGLRMTAAPGSADYSSFSLLCQWAYDVEPIRDIAPAAFWPKPNVESRALRFTKKQSPQPVRDARLFLSLVRGLFSARRKTVKNNLSAFLAAKGKKTLSAESLLKVAEIDPAARAESLTIYDFIRLSDTLAGCDE
ncbi:16S rRNA (adenine(1518)-N(6)/adenine(1519)-N(6))- dimethyltransferase RsmA [Treponema medium]|uniref:16S rRNA (adenine(1518)-N(6)/adenine(1519)-N(6))- dimethyltransferase RsmA n=1 Tax=Treponema medium TaxID=58231 RepID=UPI0019809586|nr:16S rRNA (adenine(1518)-N(6)/adenine(1519)-N(6))-dimethyltransferase RsmA [Treponema medium]QSH93362.1 16S rRNA (adenine(1518)-N(6)/adenine(1519)-N(6))- dimethyltransferase RsmA [Treponema medium]